MAKNEKGQQQNITENDGVIQQHYKDIIAQVMDSDPDNIWMVVEKARKMTPTKFKALVGVPIETLCKYLRYKRDNIIPMKQKSWEESVDAEEQANMVMPEEEALNNNEFVKELLDLMGNFGMPVADFCRVSSYGEARGRIVVIDYGLTQDIWDQYYKRN